MLANDYVLSVCKVVTDNVYRVIGKIFVSSLEKIERIDYVPWAVERENYWKECGIEIINYVEPKLSEDD